jgi:hypothetical protein
VEAVRCVSIIIAKVLEAVRCVSIIIAKVVEAVRCVSIIPLVNDQSHDMQDCA